MDALKAESQKLAAEKRAAYREYRAVRKDMQEIVTAKENIDRLFGDGRAEKQGTGAIATVTQQQAQSADFGPTWPEVAGFWAAGPNKQFYGLTARENP